MALFTVVIYSIRSISKSSRCPRTTQQILEGTLQSLTMTILLLLLPCIVSLFFLRYRNVFRPGWTSRRSLPKPDQQFWLLRLFHEPNGFELERWSREVAHDGVIRYFGILNGERLFAVSPRAVKDLLVSDAYKFLSNQSYNLTCSARSQRGVWYFLKVRSIRMSRNACCQLSNQHGWPCYIRLRGSVQTHRWTAW